MVNYDKNNLKTYRKKNIKMYDYSNKALNLLISNTEPSTVVLAARGKFIVLRDHGDWKKGQILSEKEFFGSAPANDHNNLIKNKISDDRKKDKEKILMEQKHKILVSQAEKLIVRPRQYDILAHIRKMENSLEEAINSDFYNLSAYYIDLGHLHYILTAKFNYDLSHSIEDYFFKAMQINPESQNSRIGLIQYFVRKCMFTTAVRYVSELKNSNIRNNFIAGFAELSSVYIPTNKESNYEALQLIKQFQPANEAVDLLRLHLYFWVGDLSSAENEYKHIVDSLNYNIAEIVAEKDKEFREDRLMRVVVNSLVWIANLDRSGSNLEQRKGFINSVIRDGEAILPRNEMHFDNFQTNKCCALLTIEEYQTVVDILSKQIVTNPNNTDFSNIAFGYYGVGDIQKAKYYANKAFATQVDEQILNLLVLISYVEKDYPQALDYALQSLVYVEKQTDGTQSYIDNDGKEKTSFSNAYYSKEKADFLQKTMVNVFITSGYYDAALRMLDERITNNPFDMEYVVLKTSTEKLLEMDKESENKIKELEERYLIINEDLEKKIRIQNQMRELLNNFVSLQSSFNEIDSDDDISNFLSNVQKNMTNYVNRQHSPRLNERVRKFEIEFKKQFNRLEKLSLEQLSIAEALFEEFDYAPLDYGMLAVIYGKVIEIELQKLLKSKGHTHIIRNTHGKTVREKIDWNRGLKIAECRDLLRNYPVNKLEDIDVMIEAVRKARNNSAHTGECTLETVSNVRNYLYEQSWLQRLNSQL
ncbi:hypothetical protein [Trichococcus shcherbakoviae]|uniref:hypothetical protein n=1 Tax=Trichococcus shcherbakoviae TaxID=2094020 RepID=UPI002AA6DCA3|nr:hypothetical protein [Trichococcus shcherbakoviae]